MLRSSFFFRRSEKRRISPSFEQILLVFFFSSRRRHTRFDCDWSSDVCSSDLPPAAGGLCSGTGAHLPRGRGGMGCAAPSVAVVGPRQRPLPTTLLGIILNCYNMLTYCKT